MNREHRWVQAVEFAAVHWSNLFGDLELVCHFQRLNETEQIIDQKIQRLG